MHLRTSPHKLSALARVGRRESCNHCDPRARVLPQSPGGFHRVVIRLTAFSLMEALDKCPQNQRKRNVTMKKSIIILFATFALIGCKQEGGTSDQYSTDRGSNLSARTNAASPSSISQGSATTPSESTTASETSTNTSTNGTNSPKPSP